MIRKRKGSRRRARQNKKKTQKEQTAGRQQKREIDTGKSRYCRKQKQSKDNMGGRNKIVPTAKSDMQHAKFACTMERDWTLHCASLTLLLSLSLA